MSEGNGNGKSGGLGTRARASRAEHQAKKQRIVQQRFAEFTKALGLEVGEPALTAFCVVHWVEDMSAAAALMNAAPPSAHVQMLGEMVTEFVQRADELKVQLNEKLLERREGGGGR